jgi:hypothetical protein
VTARGPAQPPFTAPERAALSRVHTGTRVLTLALTLCLAVTPARQPRASEPAPLRAKAQSFRDALVERHLSREGVLLYEMSLSDAARDLEQGTYPMLADTPTFTGILAATSCLQAELGDAPEQARADAEKALAGLQLLSDVTGVPGLLARSVRRDAGQNVEGLRGRWYRGGPGYENFRWRGDVSADQYANGLLLAAAACAGVFPERSERLLRGFVQHMEVHGRRLVDPDGQPTRFGDLTRFSGAGWNSIFQLCAYAGYALLADLTGDPLARRRQRELRDEERLVAGARITNVNVLGLTNHSNDNMAFHLYRALIPMARRSRDPALADLRHGLWRAWLRVREQRNAYFTATFCALEPQSCDRTALADARALLQAFPPEKRRRAPPAALSEIPRSWLPGRKLRPLALRWIPIELRPPSSFEWKSSPYRLDYTVQPDQAYTGLDFMAAYWILRAAETQLAGQPGPAGLTGAPLPHAPTPAPAD